MSNFCKVISDRETGKIINESTTSPGFGTVRLESKELVVTNGFLNEQKRSALVRGEVDVLKKMFSTSQVQGKIIRKTSNQPMYKKRDGSDQDPVINPTTGELAVRADGNIYYQQFVFTQDTSATDVEVKVKVEEQVEA